MGASHTVPSTDLLITSAVKSADLSMTENGSGTNLVRLVLVNTLPGSEDRMSKTFEEEMATYCPHRKRYPNRDVDIVDCLHFWQARDAEIAEAKRDRDMQWWQAVVLVDSVAPTPEAAKKWLLELSKYEQEAAKREMFLDFWEETGLGDKPVECDTPTQLMKQFRRAVEWEAQREATLCDRQGEEYGEPGWVQAAYNYAEAIRALPLDTPDRKEKP